MWAVCLIVVKVRGILYPSVRECILLCETCLVGCLVLYLWFLISTSEIKLFTFEAFYYFLRNTHHVSFFLQGKVRFYFGIFDIYFGIRDICPQIILGYLRK